MTGTEQTPSALRLLAWHPANLSGLSAPRVTKMSGHTADSARAPGVGESAT
jgi:hypothetical protein